MTQAIFLSYASQDADAARRVCEALLAAGLEVWFDQSELRGGDAWDASIKKQIKECALFVPIISANTNAREEGYFRLEWKLAVDRSHLMADNKAFFVPVMLGDVSEPAALVPDKFRERQWSRLNGDQAIAAFAARVSKLLAGSGVSGNNAPTAAPVLANTALSAAAPTTMQTHVADEGFWVAVLPFKHRGSNTDLAALAEGMSEDIVTGLSRFSYLRVIARGATLQLNSEAIDVRAAGNALGARYVMEGNLRSAGTSLRVSVQLVDVNSGATLWAETYERAFKPEDIFALQDDLVPRIVSTVADSYGVLAHCMSGPLRSRAPDSLSPLEAVLRSFGFMERINPEEHAVTRAYLERAVEKAPDNADCWAMLTQLYVHEYSSGFNPRPDPIGRTLAAAQRAVAAGPANHLAYHALACALHFNNDRHASRHAAERALALNPWDASTTARVGMLIAFMGDWEAGCALIERARQLNPNHPGFYWMPLAIDAYRRRDYQGALSATRKINMPGYFYVNVLFVAAHAQLGECEAAAKALRELLALRPDFAVIARFGLARFGFTAELVEHIIEGLQKAGMEFPSSAVAPVETMTTATTESATPTAAKDASIAVLAFANRSASADDEYFSDGLADELLNVLAKIKGLRVAARTSAFSFKGKQATVAEIGRALNVATVLDGSVRKSGNRVRISVELVKVADGYHLWSETYDRTLDDIFAVQDDIAQAVVKELRTTLMGETASVAQTSKVTAEVASAVQGRSENSEAHRLLLQARFLIDRHAAADLLQGIQYLRQALTIDPEYALAWAWLSRALTYAASLGSAPVVESNAEALEAARRALQLAPDSLEAHLAICWHKIMYEWDWQGAEAALQHALKVAPGNADALSAAALLYYTLGRMEAAEDFGRRAVEQDPLNSTSYRHLAQPLAELGRFDEAEQAYRRAIEISPDGPALRYRLAMVLEKHGRHADAIAEASSEKADWARWNALAILHFLGGDLAESDRWLNELIDKNAHRAAFQIAMCCAVRGNADAAFEWLERAYLQRDSGLSFMKTWWVLEPIHGDPRWRPFLKKMGFAD